MVGSAAPTTAPRVLIVEDDFDIRAMIGLALEMEGFEVTAAANGNEALDRLRSGYRPGLILLDLMMPVMNGWEFRSAQRADPVLAEIPTVILSGDGNVGQKTAELAAASYIRKPVDLDDLHAAVKTFCPPSPSATRP